MTYDDHDYCMKCDKHLRFCWCFGDYIFEEMEYPFPDSPCPGGKGHDEPMGWQGGSP